MESGKLYREEENRGYLEGQSASGDLEGGYDDDF